MLVAADEELREEEDAFREEDEEFEEEDEGFGEEEKDGEATAAEGASGRTAGGAL